MSRRMLLDTSLLVVATLAALTLKHHYGHANADGLDWLLAPATFFVEHATGEHFVQEARVGFVGEGLPIIIAPACAGVNFLVIAFLTLTFGFLPKLGSTASKMLWLAAAALVAYAATTVANTARISAAVAIQRFHLHAPLVSAAQLHRALGVVVYLCALWLLFAWTERVFTRIVRTRGAALPC